jgi:hypothetical protein
MHYKTVVLFAATLLAAATTGRAQLDPAREIQEIARAVEQQLQQIDELLLASGRKNQARSQPREMLQQARERAEAVEGGLDKLIEKLNQMKNQGGGGGSPEDQQNQRNQQQQDQQDQQQRQQDGQQQDGRQRNRRENQTPDFVQQPQAGEQQGQQQPQQQGQPQPGEQQPSQPQPQPGDPRGGQENPDGGANQRGNQQPEPETGPGNPGTGDGGWGELQPYMNFLKNRGSRPPAVPEKYRKYWEAYLKQKQGAGNSGGTRGSGGR